MNFVEKGGPLTYCFSGVIQKRDKCITVWTTTYSLTNIETDIWIEKNREANVFFRIIYSGKLLLKKQKIQQYQSWVIAIIKHNYIHNFLMEKHFSSFFPCVSLVTNYGAILHKTFWSLKFTPGFSIWLNHTFLILICYWIWCSWILAC